MTVGKKKKNPKRTKSRRRIISIAIVISLILLSIFAGYYYIKSKPHFDPCASYKFSVDAGPDAVASTNETVIFRGKLTPQNNSCQIYIHWDVDGDGKYDWVNGVDYERYDYYYNTSKIFYCNLGWQYKTAGVYYARFMASDINNISRSDVRKITIYDTKINLTISALDDNLTGNDALNLSMTISNQGRGFNISDFSEVNQSVKIFLIRDDGIVFAREIDGHYQYAEGPVWLGSGMNHTKVLKFDLNAYYENRTVNAFYYIPMEHPGTYQAYIRFTSMNGPISWRGSTTSNIITFKIS